MALHIMLKFLKRESDSEHKTRILFVVRNRALAQFIAVWVAHRVEDPRERDETLGRLWMLFAPLEDGPRRTTVEDGLVCFKKQSRGGESMMFDMMVADEAHHLYSEQTSRDAIATYCGEQTRLLLLCDISQSMGSGIECLAGLGITRGFDTAESTNTVLTGSLFVCVYLPPCPACFPTQIPRGGSGGAGTGGALHQAHLHGGHGASAHTVRVLVDTTTR